MNARENIEAIRVLGFWAWLFYWSGAYSGLMRLAHRFHWHHAPPVGGVYAGRLFRCSWCGLMYEMREFKGTIRR